MVRWADFFQGGSGSNTGSDTNTDASNLLFDGITAYWKMEEESGDRIDATGGGLDLADFANNIGSTPGIIGNAARFDSSVNFLGSKDSADSKWQIYNNDFTLSMWINYQSGSTPFYFSKMTRNVTVSADSYVFYSNSNALVVFARANSSSFSSLEFPYPRTVDSTDHLVFTYSIDTNTVEVFANANSLGQKVHAIASGSVQYSPTTPVYLGSKGSNDGGNNLGGWIDEVGLWNRVLSPEEITNLYNNGEGLTY